MFAIFRGQDGAPWLHKISVDNGHKQVATQMLSTSPWKLSPIADVYFTARAPRRFYRLDRGGCIAGRWRCGVSYCALQHFQLGSFGANPTQEELYSSLSMSLLCLWIGCDAVQRQAFAASKHKIEEDFSRKFRVIHLDMTAGG